jgi:hypothetical protein
MPAQKPEAPLGAAGHNTQGEVKLRSVSAVTGRNIQ